MKKAKKINLILILATIFTAVLAYHLAIKPIFDEKDFLLKKLDHRAVSMACMDVLTKPEYRSLIGSNYYKSDFSKFPPAIRAIKPDSISVTSDAIGIITPYRMALTFSPSETASNRFDLVYCKGMGGGLLLYSVPSP